MAIERVEYLPRPHLFTEEEYLAFEARSEFKHEFIDGVIFDWGDVLPGDPVHPDYVPGYPMPHLFTEEEYLAFEAESEFKHEFIDGVIYDMTGGTLNHSRIKVNITVALGNRLLESNYIVCNSDMQLGIGGGRYVYPDLSVVYGAARLSNNELTLLNPIIAVEVTSPSSRDYDYFTKLEYYRAVASLRAYLIIEQRQCAVELHALAGTGWRQRSYSAIDDVIPLDMIGCDLPLSEIYRGIEFTDE